MAKRAAPVIATDEEVRVLLEHYRCPVPFHEVRTRFLGNIATPAVGVSPIKIVEDLWGGELPEFNSIDAANELIGALIMGLWNRLTRHQERHALWCDPMSWPREKAWQTWRRYDVRSSTDSSRDYLGTRQPLASLSELIAVWKRYAKCEP